MEGTSIMAVSQLPQFTAACKTHGPIHIGPRRYAPSFSIGDSGIIPKRLYTSGTLTQFLGWKLYKVESALSSLALVEYGVAGAETFKDLSSAQAQAVAQQGRRILNETDDAKKARVVVKGLAAGMRSASGKGPTPADRKVRRHVQQALPKPLMPSGIEPLIAPV
jgi:hypothetical protein